MALWPRVMDYWDVIGVVQSQRCLASLSPPPCKGRGLHYHATHTFALSKLVIGTTGTVGLSVAPVQTEIKNGT